MTYSKFVVYTYIYNNYPNLSLGLSLAYLINTTCIDVFAKMKLKVLLQTINTACTSVFPCHKIKQNR